MRAPTARRLRSWSPVRIPPWSSVDRSHSFTAHLSHGNEWVGKIERLARRVLSAARHPLDQTEGEPERQGASDGNRHTQVPDLFRRSLRELQIPPQVPAGIVIIAAIMNQSDFPKRPH